MIARSPEELHHHWVKGINAGDLQGLSELYEPDTAFVVEPGKLSRDSTPWRRRRRRCSRSNRPRRWMSW